LKKKKGLKGDTKSPRSLGQSGRPAQKVEKKKRKFSGNVGKGVWPGTSFPWFATERT